METRLLPAPKQETKMAEDLIVQSLIKKCKANCETALFLNYENLSEIPEAVLQIKILKRLYLKRNLLKSVVSQPKEINLLASLVQLYLNANMIEKIPESIGDLQCLESLELDHNEISKLPVTIGKLSKLKSLLLSHNNLSRLPPEIGQLKCLQTLNLVNNKIEMLPRELGQCTKLQTLQIDGNRIQFLIEELMRLPSLQEISASRNKLLYIPFDIHHLPSLTDLVLDANTNMEMLPGSLIFSPCLRYVGLHDCKQERSQDDQSGWPARCLNELGITWIGSVSNKILSLRELCLRKVGKLITDDGTEITEQTSLPIELIKALESPLGSCTVCNDLIYNAVFLMLKSTLQMINFITVFPVPNAFILDIIVGVPQGFSFVFIFCSFKCFKQYEF